jgi:hypothetical protein
MELGFTIIPYAHYSATQDLVVIWKKVLIKCTYNSCMTRSSNIVGLVKTRMNFVE